MDGNDFRLATTKTRYLRFPVSKERDLAGWVGSHSRDRYQADQEAPDEQV